MRTLLAAAFFVFTIVPVGCGKAKPKSAVKKKSSNRELGENCKATSDCRARLICLQGTCAPGSARETPGGMRKAYEMGGDRMDRAIRDLDKGERFE